MNRWTTERWAASTGLGFVILLLIGNFLPGAPKHWNASATDIQGYLQGKHKELIVGGILLGLGYVLFLWFLASFAGMFREAGQGRLATIVYGAGVATVAIAALCDGIFVALAKVTYIADPRTVQAIYGVGSWMYGRVFFAMAALALASWLAVQRSRVLPEWYGWLSLAGGIIFLVGGVALKNNGFFSVSGMGVVAFSAFAVWIALSSLLLVGRTDAAHAPAATPSFG